MTDASDDAFYSLKSIREMLGMSRSVVAGYVAAGFVTPTRGPRNALRFGFQDVVLLRTAQQLRLARIPARRIKRALQRLRARLPPSVPLTGLRITAIGDDVTVRDDGQQVAADSGQILLDFDVAIGAGRLLDFPMRIAPETTPDATDDWLARGEALEADDPDAAMAVYRQAMAASPAHRDAFLNLGALLHERGRHQEALAIYDEAAALGHDDAELWFNRAIALEDLGRVDDALAAYERCVVLDAAFADAHWNAARLYEKSGIPQDAIRHFNAFRRLERR